MTEQTTEQKGKKYVKEYEFVGGDAPERTRQAIDNARDKLFVMEYRGRALVKLPLIVAVLVGLVGFVVSAPVTITLVIGLTALGFLTPFSVKIEDQAVS